MKKSESSVLKTRKLGGPELPFLAPVVGLWGPFGPPGENFSLNLEWFLALLGYGLTKQIGFPIHLAISKQHVR